MPSVPPPPPSPLSGSPGPSLRPSLPLALVDRIVLRALEEDLHAGDVTTDACIDPEVRAAAHAVARSELVVCGGLVFRRAFELVDPETEVVVDRADGVLAAPGVRLWTVRGRARALLMAERVALNLVQ